MTNEQVCNAFHAHKWGQSESMHSDGNKLFSYGTVIMQQTEHGLIGNTTKYSRTTTNHQTLANMGQATIFIGNVPRGEQNLEFHIRRFGNECYRNRNV